MINIKKLMNFLFYALIIYSHMFWLLYRLTQLPDKNNKPANTQMSPVGMFVILKYFRIPLRRIFI